MDFGTGFGDGFHNSGITGHILRHILNNGKGGYDLKFFLCRSGISADRTQGKQQHSMAEYLCQGRKGKGILFFVHFISLPG